MKKNEKNKLHFNNKNSSKGKKQKMTLDAPLLTAREKHQTLLLESLDMTKSKGSHHGKSSGNEEEEEEEEEETIPAARPPFPPPPLLLLPSSSPSFSPSSSSPSSPPFPFFTISRMRDSDILEVLATVASSFPAEVKGLGLSTPSFVALHSRLLSTPAGRRAFGVAGVAREKNSSDNGNAKPGAFLGVAVVQGSGGDGVDDGEEEEESEPEKATPSTFSSSTSSSSCPSPLSLFSSKLRSLSADFSSLRAHCGTKVAALTLARDLLLPEALAEGELLLEYLAVAPRARGRGVGRALLRVRSRGIRKVGRRERPAEEEYVSDSVGRRRERRRAGAVSLEGVSEGGSSVRERQGKRGRGRGRGGRELRERPRSSLPLLSEAARTLWHRALCRFFLCTSCWVRLALPLKGEAK